MYLSSHTILPVNLSMTSLYFCLYIIDNRQYSLVTNLEQIGIMIQYKRQQ